MQQHEEKSTNISLVVSVFEERKCIFFGIARNVIQDCSEAVFYALIDSAGDLRRKCLILEESTFRLEAFVVPFSPGYGVSANSCLSDAKHLFLHFPLPRNQAWFHFLRMRFPYLYVYYARYVQSVSKKLYPVAYELDCPNPALLAQTSFFLAISTLFISCGESRLFSRSQRQPVAYLAINHNQIGQWNYTSP